MINSEIKENIQPICPYCSKEITKLWMQEIDTILGKRYIYFCPDCRKVLGITHRKGYLWT